MQAIFKSSILRTAPIKKQRAACIFYQWCGLVKIGVAEYPQSRLETLQNSSPAQLVLVCTIPGGFEKEKELHAKFSNYRRHGEWFEYVPEIATYIEETR